MNRPRLFSLGKEMYHNEAALGTQLGIMHTVREDTMFLLLQHLPSTASMHLSSNSFYLLPPATILDPSSTAGVPLQIISRPVTCIYIYFFTWNFLGNPLERFSNKVKLDVTRNDKYLFSLFTPSIILSHSRIPTQTIAARNTPGSRVQHSAAFAPSPSCTTSLISRYLYL